MSIRKTIIKNSLYLISGEALSKILLFFFTVIVARALGVADFGKFNFAVSFVLILSVLVDFGMNVYIMREIPRNREHTSGLVGNVFGMRLIFAALVFAVIVILMNILNYPEDTRNLIYLLSLWMVLIMLTNVMKSSFKGAERMEYDVGLNISYNFLVLSFVIIFFQLGYSVFSVAFSVLLASIVTFCLSIIIHTKKISRVRLEVDIKEWARIIKAALPLALTGLLIAQFGRIDILMLSWLQGDEAVGLYSAPFKLVITIYFVYTSIVYSAFPKMSEYAFSEPERFSVLAGNTLKSIVIIAGFSSMVMFIFSSMVINLVYGMEYAQSVQVFNILIWINVLNAIAFGFIFILNAKNLQKINALFVGIAIGVDIVLNLILIPRYSYIGASVSTLLSEVFLVIMLSGYVLSKRHVHLRHLVLRLQDLRLVEKGVSIKE